MRLRICASVLPRQSLKSLIRASICAEAEMLPVPAFELFFFIVVAAFLIVLVNCPRPKSRTPTLGTLRLAPAFLALCTDDSAITLPQRRASHALAWQLARLLHPVCELSFVEGSVLVNVKIAY